MDPGRESAEKKRDPRAALEPLTAPSTLPSLNTSGPSKLEVVSKVFMAPFGHKKTDSNRILSDLAPVIMTPRMMHSASNNQSRPRQSVGSSSLRNDASRVDFATIGRAPLRLTMGSRRITSRDLQIVEATEELLDAEVPDSDSNVSLLRGFNATIPSADKSRTRRRQMRNVDVPKMGLKRLGMSARGLLADEEDAQSTTSMGSEDDMVLVGHADKGKGKAKRGRQSLSAAKVLGKEELKRQTKEIMRDKENLHVRRSLIKSEIVEIGNKIAALDSIREKLEHDLQKLQEEELELDDELTGVTERMEYEDSAARLPKSKSQTIHIPQSSRRRKGPAFLPSEHDDLPPGVAFMTLEGHMSPISALDFSEPYGTLVTAAQNDTQPRVWDLFNGEEIGRLRGHTGAVRCVQVEDHVCLTGAADGNVKLWDLRRVDEEDAWDDVASLCHVTEEGSLGDDGELVEASNGIRSSERGGVEATGPCARTLEGHSKAVTALYFEDECLVTGASDKTLRQWDLTTGQCVMTMDILWAISHPPPTLPGEGLSSQLFPGAVTSLSSFAVPTPPYSDGSWDMYTDFVGGVQFWGYGLVSGSGDGAVRMWDMRTGQAHRTLLGHTAPITCLQFDELHIVSGSLDKTIRVWDLRTGGVSDTFSYDHAVTALQFDSRKIVAATGENGIKIFNRTSGQHSSLLTNGHTAPVERMRFMDRYMVSGGRDACVKIWSL